MLNEIITIKMAFSHFYSLYEVACACAIIFYTNNQKHNLTLRILVCNIYAIVPKSKQLIIFTKYDQEKQNKAKELK